MSALAIFNRTGANAVATDLETLLLELARFGKPTIGLGTTGWHCGVSMNTNTTGTSFDVRSDFGHKTPIIAATECMERVQTALATLAAGDAR